KEKEGQTFWQWNYSSKTYNIHYIERGEGANHVLLLHGFGAHSYTWRFMVDELAKAGYHVWSIDLIGFGYSDKPRGVAYDLHLFTEQIEAFMQAKQIDQPSLIGNSMGGGLALNLVVNRPDHYRSLILIDALAFPIKLPFYFAVTKSMGKLVKP